MTEKKFGSFVEPGSFEMEEHFYTKVLNATIHPLVSFFFGLSNKQIIARYKHLNPAVDVAELRRLLTTPPKEFRWAGADLFYCTNERGNRQMVVVETNSCPSGQKSFPLLDENDELGGYRRLIEGTLKPVVEKHTESVFADGYLAVVYDKNPMETVGYARTIADVFGERVLLVALYDDDKNDPAVKWRDGVMHVRMNDGEWRPVRAAFRYVTQRPWTKFPAKSTKTLVLNPVVACLAGGRNKLVAAKAYQFFNSAHGAAHLEIRTPETVRDLSKSEVPLWVESFGGFACVKVPYSNAGQGVYTITNKAELDAFMESDTGAYELYIVQSLIASYNWSSQTSRGQLYHVGSVPNKKNGSIFVADVRMMIHFDLERKQFRPLAMYSRRAPEALPSKLEPDTDSWAVLGTNLSYKNDDGSWATDSNRLLIADRRDFNRLGIGIDDLIDGYVQTVMATSAIDSLAQKLLHVDEVDGESHFNANLFESLNKDSVLTAEIITHPGQCLQLPSDAKIVWNGIEKISISDDD